MKPASGPLAALINSGVFYVCDLYTITSVNGPQVLLATGDFDAFDDSSNLYSCGSIGSGYPKIDLKQSKVQGHWTRGLDADQWQVAILPAVTDPFTGGFSYPDVIGGTPWLAACCAGLFDGATVVVQRAYYPAPPTLPLSVADRTCLGTIVVFSGIVGVVDCNQTLSVFTINDYKYLLGMNMPRNLVQGSCRHTLFDARCGLSAAAYAKTAVALTGSTPAVLLASPATPGGSGSYALGRTLCTSGANGGFQRTITQVAAGSFQLQYPFPFPITAGDGFTFWPGCDKTLGAGGCGTSGFGGPWGYGSGHGWGYGGGSSTGFNNMANFGGAPNIPVPEIQIG